MPSMETNAPCQITLVQVESGELIKISGTIRHYTCERGEANFVLAKKDKYRMGMVAVLWQPPAWGDRP